MVAIAIFWAALFCIIFFLLGAICKGLAAVFNALISSIVAILGIAFLVLLGVIGLYTIYSIVDGIITGRIGEVFGLIVLFVIGIGLLVLLFGWLGNIMLSIALKICELILSAISFVLERGAAICEKAYAHFLLVIVNRLEKC